MSLDPSGLHPTDEFVLDSPTVRVAAAAIALSAFPDFVNHAQPWITHLGNLGATAI